MFEISNNAGQIGIFIALTLLIALMTQWQVKRSKRRDHAGQDGSSKFGNRAIFIWSAEGRQFKAVAA